MIGRALLLAAALPLAQGVAQGVAQGAPDTTAAKASLLAADRAAAQVAAQAGVLAAAFAPTATALLPGLDILRGIAALTPHMAALGTAAPRGATAWTPLQAVVSRDGSLGCTSGVLHRVASDSTQPRTGRYANCWQRGRDGAWRLLALSQVYAPAQVSTLPDSLPAAPGSTGTTAARGANATRDMAAADRAFARFSADSGGPAGAFARWIAADGMMLGARAVPVRGPEQARAAFAGFPATGAFQWWPIDSLTVASQDGSLGFTIGEAVITSSPGNVSYSKYLTIWRRERDGQYRFVFDIGSDRPAPGRH